MAAATGRGAGARAAGAAAATTAAPLAAPTLRAAPPCTCEWRLELFFKDQAQLAGLIPFLRRHRIDRVNITHKDKRDALTDSVRMLRSAGVPDVCVHYSIKNQPASGSRGRQGVEERMQQLSGFLDGLSRDDGKPVTHDDGMAARQPARRSGGTSAQLQAVRAAAEASAAAPGEEGVSVLLVNGSGPKKEFNTVSALQQLAARRGSGSAGGGRTRHMHAGSKRRQPAEPTCPPSPPGATDSAAAAYPRVYVAFNPYLPKGVERETEYERLRQKLATGVPAGVYLQVGTSMDALEDGLQFLSKLLAQAGGAGDSDTRVKVLGSVFVPSKRLLAQMHFRPWSGVFLSDEYLSGVEAADAITRQLLRAYAQHGVVPLVESSVKTDDELSYVYDLIVDAYSSNSRSFETVR